MITPLYSVYDQKAQIYLPPFTFSNDLVAVRTFADSVNDPTHAFAKHPADYTLFYLGTYDDNTAEIDTTQTPMSLGTGLEHLDSTEVNPLLKEQNK